MDLVEAMKKSRERAVKDGEQPLDDRNMHALVEQIQREKRRGSDFKASFEEVFPGDTWRKRDVAPEQLDAYAEFARDYFGESFE